ncbi:unnamed protein product, partial [Ectocarpus sp. 12 AP-2014]
KISFSCPVLLCFRQFFVHNPYERPSHFFFFYRDFRQETAQVGRKLYTYVQAWSCPHHPISRRLSVFCFPSQKLRQNRCFCASTPSRKPLWLCADPRVLVLAYDMRKSKE